MAGANWEFANSLHAAHEFDTNWPAGLLCHTTSETPDGICAKGIWTNETAEAAYFRDFVVDVLTQAMAELGPAMGRHGAIDFEPDARSIEQLIVGQLLGEFQEIGADADGTAIGLLGTTPYSLDASFADATSAQIIEASRSLGLDRTAPEGLIMLLDECDAEGAPHHTQTWRSLEEADAFWNESFLPALIEVGATSSEQVVTQPRRSKMRRISVDAAALATVWRA